MGSGGASHHYQSNGCQGNIVLWSKGFIFNSEKRIFCCGVIFIAFIKIVIFYEKYLKLCKV